MKPLRLLFLYATFAASASSAADFATQMVEATFKLFHPDSAATCFLLRREPGDAALYLATAAHVLERTKGDTAVLVLREQQTDGAFKRRDHTIAIRQKGKPLWVQSKTDDAAVLKLTEPLPVPVAALPVTALADEAQIKASGLRVCSPLFVLTYPNRTEGNPAGFPLARSGIIASHPLLPIAAQRTFMADFTTFAGDSGGPAFVADPSSKPLVIGMVLAQINQEENVTLEFEKRTLRHPLGLGKILHAQFLRELVEQCGKPETH
ncbi:MAG: serine protease [Verrucomicrobia bacterium]|nr:serine protease [Verrucomicrobiota bacterium]NBU10582.1 serine protease [Pseudomonadota bacterium]NDA65762.1 serine protease [Verrucomicrobiota bacterium]NDB74658.1 serine protease [Verrucomicrobiota bacterium]NDD39115.1 serine protease [Verrucomicrobiota bacterium]